MIRIVLVEDLDMIREGIKLLISQITDFLIVAEYKNGQEFVDNLDNLDCDIVITDIDMPVLNGIDATKIAIAKKPNLKIIALSLYNDSKYYYELITAGAKGFVLKQSSVEELEQAIREVNTGKSYFSEQLLYNVIVNMQNIEQTLVEEKKNLLQLTNKESELLTLICKGLTNKELADKLFLSTKTIESNKAKLMRKTGAKNNASLIIWAIKNKIVEI
ncbi:response regulator transcription factor [Plebeiibacterium marinum]|uniref:Response regulator transcription factor n=1 Tax=Plebeiibacterium marinum TaxID=2992111 RepID=A0AAE3MJ77_9BACT|nr:response regulator transcription factor [Plebeiobacterium marinum]MCW3808052.1 response regulator transcription factor [Plebeiobacterium marinum]